MNQTPRVQFVFDSKKEIEYIDLLIKKLEMNPLSTEEADFFKNDQARFAKKIEESYKDELKKQIEKDWAVIEANYFDKVEEITGHKWLHNGYKVILTSTEIGLCNPFNPETDEVAVSHAFPPLVINYLIAHELFHSHYFHIVNQRTEDKLFNTELNENCAVLALLFSDIKTLFPFADDAMVKSCIESHKNAAAYFPKLFPVWEQRKSFDDYLEKSVEVFK